MRKSRYIILASIFSLFASLLALGGPIVDSFKFITGDGPAAANIEALLHCDGTDEGTTFTDDSNNSWTVTANGNVNTETSQKKYGSASAEGDGTGDYLSISDHADLRIGTDQFCIEMWVRVTGAATGNDVVAAKGTGAFSTGMWSLYCATASSQFTFRYSSSGYLNASGQTDNTWQHVAVTRDSSNVIRIFLDGTQKASVTSSQNFSNTGNLQFLGGNSGAELNGYVDDIRVVIGEPVYTTNFTPPTSAHPDP